MGRQARIKRERARQRAEAPQPEPQAQPNTKGEAARDDDGGEILTVPMPGAEHMAGADGTFDDCDICKAMRRGDRREAKRLIREEARRQAREMQRASN